MRILLYEYDIHAITGAIADKEIKKLHSHSNSANDNSSSSYIGIENAKSIAVGHASFSLTDVHFSKAKIDHDDGIMIYEIEFYKDKMKYEYKIDAVTGNIIEFECDN